MDAARADATTPTSGAAIANEISGVGGARDSGATARPNLEREYLTEEELIALLRGSVYRRIIELKPRWATARGWAVTDDSEEERPLEKEMRRLGVRAAIQSADTWARTLGESRILLVTDDAGDLSEPLDATKVRRLHRLEVLDRREFTPIVYNSDASAGPFGEPSLYRIHPRRPGVAQRLDAVHESRLLRFYGDELPPSERGFNWSGSSTWGADAIGQTLWDGLRHLGQTGSGGAKLAQELSISVFKLSNAPSGTAADQREAYVAKWRLMNMMKSVAQSIFMGPGEEFARVAANPAGFKDLSEHARQELALLTGYPLTLLFGIAPGGLGTDGESWQEAWRADVAAYQDERYRTPLERIVEVLYWTEAGGVPDDWSIEFNPLGDLTKKEMAEIRLLHTQADSTAIMDGVLRPEEARGRYTQPGGFAAEIQPVEEAPPVVPADPGTEAEARALVEARMKGGPTPGTTGETPPSDIALNGIQAEKVDTILSKVAAGTKLPELATYQLETSFGFTPDVSAKLVKLAQKQKRVMPHVAAPPEPRKFDATEGAAWIGLPLPEDARAGWKAARAAVEAAIGVALTDPGDAPHVTVLYLGPVAADALPELAAVVGAVGERATPAQLSAGRVTVFPEGPDGWPVVLDLRGSWAVETLNGQLLRRLAHLVSRRQFAEFRPHVTLGYAATLTPEQRAAAMETVVPAAEWVAARLEARYGEEVVCMAPLAGRTDATGAAA